MVKFITKKYLLDNYILNANKVLKMNNFYRTIKKTINTKFQYICKVITEDKFNLLDVGAGNQSASKTKAVFPNCQYYGLDIDKNTNYNNNDFNLMENFYELDLTKLDYQIIPDNFFDYINMAHVIEHLHNGDLVIPLLLEKLKSNGYFYIEYPGKKSLNLPSMHGTLNFYDDPTHVRLYSINELSKIFQSHNCSIISFGVRRNWYYILLMPFRVIHALIFTGKLRGNLFWDIFGFAEYLFIKKL
ncbi:MAG: class I SAM-dependent methyltransferase [Bacteroidetes bacterium]|nr:class I SAM-dependent methyltransferase [Bacteroidota bacterium]